MASKGLRKKVFFVFKAAMAVALSVLLVINVDWSKIWAEVSQASPVFLMVATFLYVTGIFMCVERWLRAATYKKFSMTFRDATEFYMAGLFLNNFLPSFLGGDAYQGYVLGKSEKRFPAAISTVMFTRFVGLWATMILFFTFGVLGWSGVFTKPLFAWFGGMLILFMIADAALVYIYSHPRFRKIVEWLPARSRCFFNEVGGFARDRGFLRENLILSIVFAIVGVGLFNLTLFYALGERVQILPYLATVFLISLVSSLPVSINNIGFKEWAYYTFFPLIGIRPEAALAVALLVRFIQVFVSLSGAPFFFREKRRHGISCDGGDECGEAVPDGDALAL